MKKTILFLSLMGLLSLTSCKKEQDKKSEEVAVEEAKSTTFDITVELKIKKDDDLIIYYKDGTNEWIVEDKSVWNSVKGSEDFQTVVFKMPEGVLPNDFRFDIGRNEFKGQQPIEIRKITLSYLNSKFDILQDEFLLYFKPNKYIAFDEKTKQYSFSIVDDYYDPYFETTPLIYPRLSNVVLNK